MQYYRVKPEYANNRRYTWNSHHLHFWALLLAVLAAIFTPPGAM